MNSEKVRSKPGPKPKVKPELERIAELESKQLQLISDRQTIINEHSKKVKELEEQINNLNLRNLELENKLNTDPRLRYELMRFDQQYPSVFTIRRF